MVQKDSLGDQFNQQYVETIELVKSRAIWRVGEQLEEGEAFRCTCLNCGYESLHQRFDITRHRLLFGKSIRAIEAPRPMLRCRRCGQQQHLRDVGELVAPSTIALADEVRRQAATLAERDATAPAALTDDLRAAIAAFNEEASGPVRLNVFNEIVQTFCGGDGGDGDGGGDVLQAIGGAMFLAKDQITTAINASS